MDAFVSHHLQGVSRTYAILIPMLPRALADAVGLAYLLMRIVDTIEDATALSDDQRVERFALLEQALAAPGNPPPSQLCQPIGDNAAERALMSDLGAVMHRLAALPTEYRDPAIACGREMMAGVRMMLARSRERGVPYPGNRDAAEVRTYCYYVAGVVGVMLCQMMAAYLRLPPLLRLRDVAIELGIGLQLVNILKDALGDAECGRRYLPMTPAGEPSQAEIYRAMLDEARHSLQRGSEFVLGLPATARELRSFCGLPIAWGALTLARARRDASRAKIGRGVVRSSIDRFSRLAGDDSALRRWFTRLLGGTAARGT